MEISGILYDLKIIFLFLNIFQIYIHLVLILKKEEDYGLLILILSCPVFQMIINISLIREIV